MLAGVTIHNFLVIGTMALAFLVLGKWLAAKSGIAGLQSLFGAA